MGVQVTPDFAQWSAEFPEFSATVTSAQFATLINPAQVLHRNDGGGPVTLASTQTELLNYVLAHLAKLRYGTNDAPQPAQVVGRINSASEGSVSVGTDLGPVTNTQAFWAQTTYGETYWGMTAQYRIARYLPTRRAFGFPPPFVGVNWWRN